jgi:predicted transcriptional regulator
MSTLEAFRAEVERFLKSTGMKETRFGKEALNDPCFVRDVLRGERAPSMKTADRVRRYMAARSEQQGARV